MKSTEKVENLMKFRGKKLIKSLKVTEKRKIITKQMENVKKTKKFSKKQVKNHEKMETLLKFGAI